MSADKVLEFEDLQRVTGYTRRADVERAMNSQGIKVFQGKKGPWTTIDLVNQAGGLKAGGDNESYGADVVG